MNDSTRAILRPRRASPSLARTGAAVLAATALALVAAACGSSPPSAGSGSSSPAGGSANSATALAYSRCMRSNGVANYPGANSGNALPDGLPKVDPAGLGVSSSRYQAAQEACAYLLPNWGRLTQTQSQQDLRAMLGVARCMRSHGVPGWPDPTNGSAGWGFNLVRVHGFDPNSPQIDQKLTQCSRSLPAGIGIPLSRPGRPG